MFRYRGHRVWFCGCIAVELKQLQYFVAIVESKTISKAAKKLGMSQPPLSMQLKNLEEELQVQLIQRGQKNISLTVEGRVLYQRALSLLSMSDSIAREICDIRQGNEGTIRLGTISSCTAVYLNEKMREFKNAYPKVNFEVTEGNTYQLVDLMHQNALDAAIVRTPFQNGDFECIELEKEEMVVAGDEELLRGLPDRIIISDLKNIPIVTYRRMEKLIRDAFDKYGIAMNVYCINDDARTSLMWAGTSVAAAIVPKCICQFMRFGHLRVCTLDEKSLITQPVVIKNKGQYASKVVQNFLELFDYHD